MEKARRISARLPEAARDFLHTQIRHARMLMQTLVSKLHKMEPYDIIVIGAILTYGLVFSYFTVLKHNLFQSYAWDLGIFDQSLYSTLNGRFLQYTAEQYVNLSGCYFAIHISPILLLILPFYAVQPSAVTLLVLKSFVLGLGALPLYKLTLQMLGSKKTGTLFVFLYLMYPALQAANWFDFQPQVFLPLLLFSALYFLHTKHVKTYFASIILALMVEEHISVIVFFLSVFLLWISNPGSIWSAIKQRKLNNAVVLVITAILCIVWFFLAQNLRRSFPINPELASEYLASSNFSVLGIQGDPLLLPIYAFLNPQQAWTALMYDYPIKFLYIILLFAPLLFLPSKSRISIATVILLAPFLLSNYQAYYMIGAHYPLYLLPLIFLASLEALKGIHSSSHVPVLKIALVVTALFIVSVSPISPLSAVFTKEKLVWYPVMELSSNEYIDSLHAQLQLIPADASVLTQNQLFPHVSNRLKAYVIPPPSVLAAYPEQRAEYLRKLIAESDYVLLDLWRTDSSTEFVFQEIVANESHGVYALGSRSLLFRRGYGGTPVFENFVKSRFFSASKDLSVSSGQLIHDADSRSGDVALCPKDFRGLGVYGPYTYLLKGTYNITFVIKIDEQVSATTAVAALEATCNMGEKIVTPLGSDELRWKVYGDDLEPNKWTNITFSISVDTILTNVEFRTWTEEGSVNLFVDGVWISRISENS